ncbi:MAG: hypothetical protein U5K76_03190 [Woeseiaceae bacterium]|nr:hypothetical protein [Woeseiaceae bacterium]
MSDLERYDRGTAAVAPRPVSPDGKGANGLMLDWYRTEPRGVAVKPERQVLAEFFTSMLILSSGFKYKPAVGVDNYLYFVDGTWTLSLIAPHEWTAERRNGFVGTCVLHRDMTWTIQPAEQLADDGPIADAIGRFFDAFNEMLDTDLTLEEILPFYVQRMPYYQRLQANALSRSIRAAVTLGGQVDVPAREWQQLLPAGDAVLLLRES